MKKPLIGVCPLVDTERDSLWMLPGYMNGISEAGGLPVMLPLTADRDDICRAATLCDGFLFTGGQDVSPALYGEEPLPECGETSPKRDAMEAALLEEALGADKPVLGICRGIQFINAALGGTLYQDLPSQRPSAVTHCQKPPYDRPAHGVAICPGSALYDLIGKASIAVNSYHHQAVKEPASGLEVMAVAEDGIIEAVRLEGKRFVWAVQWHPEFSYLTDEDSRRIFRAFVSAAAKR